MKFATEYMWFHTKKHREYRQAALLRGASVGQACGGSSRHGFLFAPATTPAGIYLARVIAWDGPGEHSKVLAQNFFVTVPM